MQTFVRPYLTKLVKIQLVDSSFFQAMLVAVDNNMNVVIKNAIYNKGDTKQLFKLMFVRGEQIQYIVLSTTSGPADQTTLRQPKPIIEPVRKMIPGLTGFPRAAKRQEK